MVRNFKVKMKGIKSTDKILVAVSGGVDSMVLLHQLHQQKIKLAVAHCNFSLRGKESDGDEEFIKKYCAKLKITFYSKSFPTKKYAKKMGVSTQMAARELRYQWFNELCVQHRFNKIAVAHHADDQIETVLLNLVRGTGISGLVGMNEVNGKVVRPLLSFSREEIIQYAQKNKLKWREDSSNTDDYYSRNKLRLKVLPVLKELNPSLLSTFQNSRKRWKNIQLVFEKAKADFLVAAAFEGGWKFETEQDETNKAFLSEILYDFGFTHSVVHYVVVGEGKLTGKWFQGKNCRLVKNRQAWILSPDSMKEEGLFLKKEVKITQPISLESSLQSIKNIEIIKNSSYAFLDASKLQFPLKLRKWERGDWFIPFGMKGKMKLSDFFTNNKFSLFDKENAWVLQSGKDIVWVVGHRIDQRFSIGENTKKVYLAQLK